MPFNKSRRHNDFTLTPPTVLWGKCCAHLAQLMVNHIVSRVLNTGLARAIFCQGGIVLLRSSGEWLSWSRLSTFPKLILRWGGGVPREGAGPKKFGMFLETQGKQIFRRDLPGFGWDIPRAPERFEKKVCVQFGPLPLPLAIATTRLRKEVGTPVS